MPLQRDGIFFADQASQQTLPIADIGASARESHGHILNTYRITTA
jgi:hypothetical protein